jgi:hypothetical protein
MGQNTQHPLRTFERLTPQHVLKMERSRSLRTYTFKGHTAQGHAGPTV